MPRCTPRRYTNTSPSRRARRFFAAHTWLPERVAPLDLRRCMQLVFGAMTVLTAGTGHAELPVASSSWVSSGSATRVTTPTNLTINQISDKAVLNWNSFNISAGSSVRFNQPSSSSVAINKIGVLDPQKFDRSLASHINGTLTANGQIYLLNQNGIIFGKGAQVNVGTLLASSMDLTDSALNKGLARALSEDSAPVVEAILDANGKVLNGNVIVEQGASIVAGNNGKVMLFAPNVINNGNIQTTNGQALLAAGTKVYLQVKATDQDLHGFYVAVDVTDGAHDENGNLVGNVTNDLNGAIKATSGNITLAGLAVNQLGRVRATTAVQTNGAVYLRAASHLVDDATGRQGGILTPTTGGTLTLGSSSVTEAVPDTTDTTATVDENVQRQSRIDLEGGKITLAGGSRVTATSGVVNIKAQSKLSLAATELPTAAPDQSRILIDSGATIDVSGGKVDLAADSQTATLQLFSEQLKDSPMQRDGILKGKTVTVDLRASGTRADGSTWKGTPLADVSGAEEGIKRTVAERSVTGGAINMVSQGDVIVADGATLNISGGQKNYTAGNIATTKLVANGQLIDIGAADPDRTYTGIVGQYTTKSEKWGVTKSYVSPISLTTYSAADSEGYDAGTLVINSGRVILDGKVVANTTYGRFQQQPSLTAPKGGQLLLDTSKYAPGVPASNITIGVGSVLEGLKHSGFNPRTDAWPDNLNETLIRSSLFGANGITRASLTTSGTIAVTEDAHVSLGTNGSLAMRGAAVDIAGTITSPGGSVTAVAERQASNPGAPVGSVTLAPGARIDVSGEWRNDNPLLGPMANRLFKIDGGSINLTSDGGDVVVSQGSSLDVSGSGWVKTNGSLVAGKGGSIALNAGNGYVDLNGNMAAYGLNQGGSLSVITDAVCISVIACNLPHAQANTNTLLLTPDFFHQHGFANYSLTAHRGDLMVAANAGSIKVQQQNRQLAVGYTSRRSGSNIESFSSVVTLPDALRKPSTLSLATDAYSNAELRVEQGARIQADPASTINLTTTSRMLVAGELVAHGGVVNLALNAPSSDRDFDASQAIWLGRSALIDVSGATAPTINTLGLKTGAVLAGGAVNVTANRGYVIAERGSRMDVSGSSDTLSVKRTDGIYDTRVLHSDAGSITLKAAEGMVLEGSMTGHAGGANALGGTLNVAVDAAQRREPGTLESATYPHAMRLIDVVADTATSDLDATTYTSLGAQFTTDHNGVAKVSTQMLDEGGFDALSLTARSLINKDSNTNTPQPVLSAGAVRFNTDLKLDRRLVIDAPLIDVAADQVHITAPYVSLGSNDSNPEAQKFVPTLTNANHALTVDADWIDVLGNSYITNANRTSLNAQHDLRLRTGSQLDSTIRQLQGSLTALGELNLKAAQIYPATLTHFSINARDVVQGGNTQYGQINVRQSGNSAGLLYSAGGSLTLNASNINQGGTLRAPFGEITLNATGTAAGQGSATLQAGSVTSTSANGAIIPFGFTEGGIDWAYRFTTSQKLVFGNALDALPEQHVGINGKAVSLQPGSVVDISAGGDLQAYEWIKGIGGSNDVLDSSKYPNRYAIVPLLGETIAPWDQQESAGFTTTIGKTIHLDGGNGLAAGEYALLPARYALLPGAYLVTEQSAYRDMPRGVQYHLLDGTTVIAGSYGVAGTNQQEDGTRGFSIISSAFLRDSHNLHRPAEYNLTLASDFFTKQAIADKVAAPRLSMDAGVLALSATQGLTLEGTLKGQAQGSKGGRGAAVDIAAGDIEVVADGTQSTTASGALPITDKALNDLGAESLSLGATRSTGAKGINLDVVSNTVTIADGVDLHAPELLLAAKDTLSVQGNATVSGTTTSSVPKGETYLLDGDSAVVRVSAGTQADLVRTHATGVSGTLDVARGATLAADGSIFIDATADVNFAGNIHLDKGDLAIGANAINLGAVPNGTSGFNLSGAQVAALSQNVDSLLLRSRSSINLYDAPALKANQVVLDTSALVARSGDAGAIVHIDAGKVTFTRSTGTDSAATVAGTHGSLQVTADDIVLGSGDYALTGFDRVTMNARNTVLGSGTGNLTVDATGDNAATHSQLNITTGVMGGETGATTGVVTDGKFTLASNGNTVDDKNLGLGASLTVQADAVNVTGHIKQQAGVINLQATGAEGVTIGDGGNLDVSGFKRVFDTTKAFANAGQVSLAAQQGDVTVTQGAAINVSGYVDSDGTGSDAGSVNVQAANGHANLAGALQANAAAGHRGGALAVDAKLIDTLDALNTRLNSNGFTEARTLRVREGDVALNSGIVAKRIEITADGANNSGGALTINAALDAHGDKGGSVRLAARNDITLSDSGSIDVHATGIGKDGGTIEMTSTEGAINLAAGSAVYGAGGAGNAKTAAGRDGSLHLTVNRDVLAALASNPASSTMALNGVLDHLRETVVEGLKTYAPVNGVLTSTDVAAGSSQAWSDADSFMQDANVQAIKSALGQSGSTGFHVRPGVEFDSTSDLTLDSTFDLSTWRFGANGDEPGYLTLRAGGNLNINQDLTDGFYANYISVADQPATSSWSYRLTAGADLGSASVFAVKPDVSASNLVLAAGSSGSQRVIRTGDGNIDINAAGDIKLMDDTSVIYTMGKPMQLENGTAQFFNDFAIFGFGFGEHGGNIALNAGRDIVGQPSDQLITDWLWRMGSTNANEPAPTAWGVSYAQFRQGVGALGGGDVAIHAGRDVDNLSASIPSIGAPKGEDQFHNEPVVVGGGDLNVTAGQDIGGGIYYVGRGIGTLNAGRDIREGTNWTFLGKPLHTTLALGDGQFGLNARRNLAIETVFNPTLMAISKAGSNATFYWSDFFTYTDRSAVQLTSVAGEVLVNGNTSGLGEAAKSTIVDSNLDAPLSVLPATFKATALSGSIFSGSGSNTHFQLAPAPGGVLELLAQQAVVFFDMTYLLSDADPSLIPTPDDPIQGFSSGQYNGSYNIDTLFRPAGSFAHAGTPIHSAKYAAQVGYTGIETPVRIVANTGDIDMSGNTGGIYTLWSSKPVRMVAGGDIIDPSITVQHNSAADITQISAGGDIVYPLSYSAARVLNDSSSKQINVDGPGELLVTAGGGINLNTSQGIATRGNLSNAALPDQGANITVLAGLGKSPPAYDAFIAAYLDDVSTYHSLLDTYMERYGIAAADALGQFKQLSRAEQLPLLVKVLAAELRTVGRDAANGRGNYDKAYAALKTLLPNVDPAKLDEGDLNLYFSRIYTVDGGDINALVPSGKVNVGLTLPNDVLKKAFSVTRSPAQLGIVAQSAGSVNIISGLDTSVNFQRVFAADGGDIMIWSTLGNIDAGRGAKTAISAPPPVITVDSKTGAVSISTSAALQGSGIRAFVTTEGRDPGNVDLFAPSGVIFVNEAGIGTAGNLTIGATRVVGADNIDVGGTAVGVPVDTGGLAGNLPNLNSAANAANNAAASGENAEGAKDKAPLAQTALSWLEVFVVGLGEDNCKQDDLECLKRQSTQ